MAANSARGRTPKNDSWLESFKYRLDRSPVAKSVMGEAALKLGQPIGAAKGALNTVKGIADTAAFVYRLGDPYDFLKSPKGQSAHEQLRRGVGQIADDAANAVRHPGRAVADVKAAARKANISLNPAVSLQAPTFAGELKRNFDIGVNQGDAGFQVGSMLVPAGAVAKVARVGTLPRVAQEAKYLAQGFSPERAARLASPYKGMGHHFYPRSGAPETYLGFKTPDVLQNFKLPREVSDSVFNVLKPRGISYGDMYALHFKVDPNFKTARLPGKGPAWNGKALGLKKYDALGRLWHGSPAPLHGTVGSLLSVGSGVGHLPDEKSR